MKRKITDFIKKSVLWSMVITLLFGVSVFAAAVTADNYHGTIALHDVDSMLEYAAYAQTVMHVTEKCALYDFRSGHDSMDEIFKLSDWLVFDIDDVDISMGAVIQKKLSDLSGKGWTYSDLDGISDCNFSGGGQNSVIMLFADLLNKDGLGNKNSTRQYGPRDIFCHGDDPGLVAMTSEIWEFYEGAYLDYSDGDPNLECSSYLDGDHYYVYNNVGGGTISTSRGNYPYSTGWQYIAQLYNAWVDDNIELNPYLIRVYDSSSMEDFSDGRGYFALMGDFEVACKAKQVDDCTSNENYGCEDVKTITYVGNENSPDYGKLIYRYEQYRYSQNAQKEISSVTGRTRSCAGIASAINNDYADVYYEQALKEYKKNCADAVAPYWDALRGQSEVVLSSTPRTYDEVLPDGTHIVFSNYDEQHDENGNLVEKMKTYEDSDKADAQANIDLVDHVRGIDYVESDISKDEYIFECKMPSQYELSVIGATDPTLDPIAGGGIAEDSCQGAGGAGALGWIVCPIMEWMGNAAEDAYNGFLKDQLNVKAELFSGDAGNRNGTAENAWKTFQGIANIFFSIILLVIIFSQLTGVGIDNYGIKKILPKLIITAVMANLSFVICQLLVDISNILGNSLQNLFNGMTGQVTFSVPDGDITNSPVPETAITGVIIAGVLVAMVGFIWRNPAVLLTLLVGLLGVLIAILFVFVLLSARQAAIIILVVISPLAFVCYALPNTKKLFDRWLNLMKGLLMVYPICGLLIGGGNFASRLLLASGMNGSFISALTAMLVSIIPLFFVPSVLKKSLNGIGDIGNKISGFGNKFGGGAKGLARNSRAFKDAQRRSSERGDRLFARRRAGIHVDGNGNIRNNRFGIRRRIAGTGVGRFLGMDAAMGAAQAKYIKDEMDREANANTFNNRGIVDAQLAKAQNAEISRIGEGIAGVAKTNVNHEIEKAQNARDKAEAEIEVGIARVDKDNIKARLQNELNEALADNAVPVVPVSVDLALQRKNASADAQELRNWTDQLANASQDTLRAQMNDAGNWFRPGVRGSTQRMQALITAMESRGMEKEVFDMLKSNGSIGNDTAVMQTLSGSKNRVLKAYGKKGGGMSYSDFMTNGTMANYAKEKGSDFLNDLDDKALNQIRDFETQGGAQIMTNDMLAQAASRITSQDAVNVIDGMLSTRFSNGERVEFSSAQFASLNQSTRNQLVTSAGTNTYIADNMIRISNEVAADPQLRSRLDANAIRNLNDVRASRGQPLI